MGAINDNKDTVAIRKTDVQSRFLPFKRSHPRQEPSVKPLEERCQLHTNFGRSRQQYNRVKSTIRESDLEWIESSWHLQQSVCDNTGAYRDKSQICWHLQLTCSAILELGMDLWATDNKDSTHQEQRVKPSPIIFTVTAVTESDRSRLPPV